MGNRAYLSIFVKSKKFSEEFVNYQHKVMDYFERLMLLSDKERIALKDTLSVLAKKFYPSHSSLFSLPYMYSTEHSGEIFYCNTNPDGEYSDGILEKKNYVPIEWCMLFKQEDKFLAEIDEGEEYLLKLYDYITTVEKALNRLMDFKSNSNLIRWLDMWPLDSLITLTYGELFLNDDFKEETIDNMISRYENHQCHYSKDNTISNYSAAKKEMKALLKEIQDEFKEAKRNNVSDNELDNILYRYRGINEAYMREFFI